MLAADWAWDVLNDPSHTYISGLPFTGGWKGSSETDRAMDRIVELLMQSFLCLDNKAIDILGKPRRP
jgi:hypothetical protein